MSGANIQHMLRQDMKLHELTVTATATVKTGTATYDGLFDNPVVVDDPAADVTLTIPDGDYVGQLLMVAFNGNTSSKTLTVTCTTGTDYTTTTSGQYTLMVWTGSVAGWAKVSGTMT